jgi:hypothetical protein
MGSKGQTGVSSDVTGGEQNAISSMQGIGSQANVLSNVQTSAGIGAENQAQNYYQALATGDPNAIARATAPAAQQITQAFNQAQQNIMQNTPAGGTKNLALEEAALQRGANIGNVASQGYLGAQQALGQMGSQRVGEGQNFASQNLSAQGGILSGEGQIGQQQIQKEQMQQAQKAQTLGVGMGLIGDATSLGVAGKGGKVASDAAGAASGAVGTLSSAFPGGLGNSAGLMSVGIPGMGSLNSVFSSPSSLGLYNPQPVVGPGSMEY